MTQTATPEKIEWYNNPSYVGAEKNRRDKDVENDRNSEQDKDNEQDVESEREHEVTPGKGGGSLPELAKQLRGIKKGGLFRSDSGEYKSVNNALSAVLNVYNRPLKRDPNEDRNLIGIMVESYVALLQACDGYVNRKNIGKSSWGAARLSLVLQIRNRAAQDKAGFLSYGDRIHLLREEDRASTMSEVLGNARIRKLNLKGKESDQKHVGGAASHVTVIDSGDLKDSNASGFFKPEETFTMDTPKNSLVTAAAKIRQQIPITDQKFELIQNQIDKLKEEAKDGDLLALCSKLEENELFVNDTQYREYVTMLHESVSTYTTMKININGNLGLQLKNNESVNLSKRNVATSRIASLLGVGNLVASSETAELIEDGKETGTRGNLMQKAKGRSANDVVMGYLKDEYIQREKEGTEGGDNYHSVTNNVTPEFQKSLSGLQVLDHLTGQVDRHTNNYMIDVDEEGKMGAVQGIDNDFAFGEGFNTTVHGRSILDDEGGLSIPHMDKTLAERILQLDEKQARFALADVLEPRAIDSFIARLNSIKKALNEVKNKNDPGGQLLDDSQWNSDTLEHFRDGNGLRAGNYIGGILNEEQNMFNRIGSQVDADRNLEIGGRILDDLIAQKKEEGMLETSDECYEFFTQYAPTTFCQKFLKYQRNMGTLTSDVKSLDKKVYAVICEQVRRQHDDKNNTETKQ